MVSRKGIGKGRGRGFKNILPKDSMTHSMSAKGVTTSRRTKTKSKRNPRQELLDELRQKKVGVVSEPAFAGKENDLPVQMALFVPSTQDIDGQISDQEFQKRIEETQEFFSKTFGGSTKIDAEGTFISDEKGKLVKEEVATVTAFTSVEDYVKNRAKVKKFIEDKKKEWGQESMGFQFEDDLTFV